MRGRPQGIAPISVNFRQVAGWPHPKVDRQGQPYSTTDRLAKAVYSRVDPGGQPICIKLTTCGWIPRRGGEAWSGVGTLVVARAALVCSMPDHHLAPPRRGRP